MRLFAKDCQIFCFRFAKLSNIVKIVQALPLLSLTRAVFQICFSLIFSGKLTSDRRQKATFARQLNEQLQEVDPLFRSVVFSWLLLRETAGGTTFSSQRAYSHRGLIDWWNKN